jgi:lysozyme family protein
MINTVALRAANAARWRVARATRDCSDVAGRLVAAKARYQAVAAKTAVPWWFIAVVHEREANQNWSASLAQGDPWNRVSVHVPAGRGPFSCWEDAAVDALTGCPPHASQNRDWSAGGALTMLEQFNGLGYAARGVPSPYLWAGTDQYKSGKYVRDGVYDASVVDTQLGCAGLLLAMMALDPSVGFDGNSPPILASPVASRARTAKQTAHHPSIAHPSKGSIGALIVSVLSSIFNTKRK